MTPKLHILLVEDQQDNIEAWNDRTNAHNADAEAHGFSVETVTAPSVAEAQRILQTQKLDAVVVDLRLKVEGQMEPNDSGNALVRYALGAHPVAIAVYTGQRQEAEVDDVPQVEVFDRGDGLDPVFAWLARQYRMLLQLRVTREAVERETARVFFRSIWPRWRNWAKDDGAEIGGMLARHVVAHVHDALLDADGGAAHPEESYFMPAIKERLDTGDLIRDADELWIVVTPRCDLANAGRVETVLLARCVDISARWSEVSLKGQARIAQHDGSHKLHFLPPILDHTGQQLGPWFVHFHDLKTIPVAQAPAELTAKRWASLAPQFVPSLVERFGAYFSRIGTPSLSSE
jgi:CheY-like chemotaxis protein